MNILFRLRCDRKDINGLQPLFIDITYEHQRIRKKIAKLKSNHWDHRRQEVTKSHPDHHRLNHLLSEKRQKLLTAYLEALRTGATIDINRLYSGEPLSTPAPPLTLNAAMLKYQESLRLKEKHHTVLRVTSVLGKLDDFTRFKDIPMDDVGREWLDRYIYHCKQSYGNKNSTILKDFTLIRACINSMVDSGHYTHNPLGKFPLKIDKVVKTKLTSTEIHTIASATLTGITDKVRDLFLFQFYTRGMRVGNVLDLRWEYIHADRIIYPMTKSARQLSIKLLPAAQAIIEKYRDQSPTHVFPLLDVYTDPLDQIKELKRKTALVNKYLHIIADQLSIPKAITSHIARHSFAKFADDKGVTLEAIQHLMGHSSISQTKHYIHDLRISDQLDDIADGMFED